MKLNLYRVSEFGQLWPAKGKSAVHRHVFLIGKRPAKENFVTRKHVNVARLNNKLIFFWLFGLI